MRKFKFIPVILGCLAAMCLTFTSCDDDDDNGTPSLTPQEQQQAFTAVSGNYSGKIIFPKYNSNGSQAGNDSLDIAWSINTDSTMTIYNFPSTVLANNLTDTVVSKAMLAEHPININCRIQFIRVTPATFVVNPVTPQYTLTYRNATHTILFPFYINTYYSYGVQGTGNKLDVQLILGGIYEDKKQQPWYPAQAIPMLLTGTKR